MSENTPQHTADLDLDLEQALSADADQPLPDAWPVPGEGTDEEPAAEADDGPALPGVGLDGAQVHAVRLPDELEDGFLGGEPGGERGGAAAAAVLLLAGGVDPVEVAGAEVADGVGDVRHGLQVAPGAHAVAPALVRHVHLHPSTRRPAPGVIRRVNTRDPAARCQRGRRFSAGRRSDVGLPGAASGPPVPVPSRIPGGAAPFPSPVVCDILLR